MNLKPCTSVLVQATFLGGGSGSPSEDAELQTQIDALDDEALELRCRRSGLSRQGGRTAQTTRLQALHAYLSGDRDSAPPQPERVAGPASDASAAAAAPPAASSWVLGGVGAPSDGTAAAGAPARPVLSKWESADLPDPSPAAEGPMLEPAPAPKPKPVEPVSRWTEVDDADDDANEPIAARIAAAAAAAAAAASPARSDRSEDIFPGSGRELEDSGSPPPPLPGAEWASAEREGGPPPLPAEIDPASVAKAARTAKEDEERRLRLRQVCSGL